VQGAIIDKPAEEDTTFQKVSTAKPNYLGQQGGNSRKLVQAKCYWELNTNRTLKPCLNLQ
jgi:hypothetical protein